MPVWIFFVIAVWPLLGLLVLALFNRHLARAGKPRLAAATHPGEILARMYLWPIVCWRMRQALHGAARHREEEG